jgi:hypothetical protein
MGNKFFIKFLNNFSHYVAFEPYLLSTQLSIKTELNSKFWRSLIQDVMMEKNERLLRDCQNGRYQNQNFFNIKYKKVTTYLYLLNHRAFPDQELIIPTHKAEQARFSAIYDTINQCLNHIKVEKYETL